MNKESLLAQYGYFNLVHSVTMKMISAFADEDLNFRPKPEMRSARELILHIYGMLKSFPTGIAQGELTAETENPTIPEKPEAKEALAQLKTIADCQAYAQACFKVAQDAVAAISDEQLAQPINSPFGTFPAWQYFSFAYDEHWHHRGQLYTYLRLIGKQPPMLYDYEN